MEQKINIAELLRDCPKGMELDCINYNGVVTFEGILDCDSYPIKISVKYDNAYFTHTLTKYGQTCISPYNKCIIFPKGKTTWEGFHRPFKDGDILSYQFKGFKNRTIYIYKQHKQLNTSYYVALSGGYDDSKLSINNKGWMALNGYNDSARLATEEEKEKLFKAIKDNGYKWNAETKTLEKITTCLNCRVFKNMHQNCPCSPIWTYKDLNEAKSHLNDETNCRFWTKILETTSSEELIEPKFKVGNKVIIKGGDEFGIITHVSDCFYTIKCKNNIHYWSIAKQDEWELVPDKPKFKVGDKIRHKTTNKNDIYEISKVYDDSYGLAGFTWMIYMKYQDQYELVPDKFDITTLKPFDKVLIRDDNYSLWRPSLWGFYYKGHSSPYITIESNYTQCIPYNDNTKHLLGTTNDCDKFYKTWEK